MNSVLPADAELVCTDEEQWQFLCTGYYDQLCLSKLPCQNHDNYFFLFWKKWIIERDRKREREFSGPSLWPKWAYCCVLFWIDHLHMKFPFCSVSEIKLHCVRAKSEVSLLGFHRQVWEPSETDEVKQIMKREAKWNEKSQNSNISRTTIAVHPKDPCTKDTWWVAHKTGIL